MSRLTRDLLDMRYHDTYWYAQVVFRTLADEQFSYGRTLHEFFGEENYPRFLGKFPQWSLLHDYILFVLLQVEFEQTPSCLNEEFFKWHGKAGSSPIHATGIEAQFADRRIPFDAFPKWLSTREVSLRDANMDHFRDYFESLGCIDVIDDKRHIEGPRGTLYSQLADEIFFLTFMNRPLLLALNLLAAEQIQELRCDELEEEYAKALRRDGALHRCHLPTWARDAIFFRDRGRCVFCNADLSRLVSLQNHNHFDHVVPLAQGGLNDVTNLQLLCTSCNLKKSSNSGATSGHVERWYQLKSRSP